MPEKNPLQCVINDVLGYRLSNYALIIEDDTRQLGDFFSRDLDNVLNVLKTTVEKLAQERRVDPVNFAVSAVFVHSDARKPNFSRRLVDFSAENSGFPLSFHNLTVHAHLPVYGPPALVVSGIPE